MQVLISLVREITTAEEDNSSLEVLFWRTRCVVDGECQRAKIPCCTTQATNNRSNVESFIAKIDNKGLF